MERKYPQFTVRDYRAFHSIDRALYVVLAIDLWRNPIESVQIIAFWLLIEQLGYKKFVNRMLSLHPSVVSQYADEAVACLKVIKDLQFASTDVGCIPMTSNLLQVDISLHHFYHNRATMAKKLEDIISEVYAKALPDLVKDAIKNHAAYDSWVHSFVNNDAIGEQPQSSHRAGALKEDRTMFITFSRGFPVNESEVRTLFINKLGIDSIESFHMQQVEPHEQALYGRIVFTNPGFIETILKDAGGSKAKFSINGKHLWVRKYVSKNRNSLP